MNRSLFQLLPGFLFKGVSGDIFRVFTFNENASVAQKILGEEKSLYEGGISDCHDNEGPVTMRPNLEVD